MGSIIFASLLLPPIGIEADCWMRIFCEEEELLLVTPPPELEDDGS